MHPFEYVAPGTLQDALTLLREHGEEAKVLAVLYAVMIPSHRDRSTALAEDLQRLGTVAQSSGGAPV